MEPQDTQETVTPTLPAKKEKTVIRSFEELDKIPVKSMADTEKVKYIENLKTVCATLATREDNLRQNCESAYAEVRILRDKLTLFKTAAKGKLHFAKQCVEHCRTSIILAGELED